MAGLWHSAIPIQPAGRSCLPLHADAKALTLGDLVLAVVRRELIQIKDDGQAAARGRGRTLRWGVRVAARSREVQAREMYQVYLGWAPANGASVLPMSEKMFGRIMVGLLDQDRRRNVRFYVNVRLRL